MNKRATKKELIKIIEELIYLCDDNINISSNDVLQQAREAVGMPVEYEEIRLNCVLYNVNIPPTIDVFNGCNYNVECKVNGETFICDVRDVDV